MDAEACPITTIAEDALATPSSVCPAAGVATYTAWWL
jgi:hypothetical protein